MIPFFVQIKCKLGQSYKVANALAEAEIASEIYSTAGHYDLLVKFYVDKETDIGHFVNERGAGHSRHPGHPHHHHLQGIRRRLAPATTSNRTSSRASAASPRGSATDAPGARIGLSSTTCFHLAITPEFRKPLRQNAGQFSGSRHIVLSAENIGKNAPFGCNVSPTGGME